MWQYDVTNDPANDSAIYYEITSDGEHVASIKRNPLQEWELISYENNLKIPVALLQEIFDEVMSL